MPPRRKAAAASGSSKKTKAVKQEQAEVADVSTTTAGADAVAGSDNVASTSAVKIEAAQIEDVKPAKRATRDTRAAKGKKAAIVADTAETVEAQAEQSTPDAAVKPEAVADSDVKPTIDAASMTDEKETTQPTNVVDDPPDSILHTSQAPDIAGVVEQREDEDLAIDDAEPAPMDTEEAKRLRERPEAARDTADEPMPHAGAEQMAAQMQQEGAAERNAAIASEAAPAGALIGGTDQTSADLSWLQPPPQAGPSMTADERKAKMAELRKRKNESAQANRKDVISAQNEHRKGIAESKRLERKRKQAEAMGEKLEAMETGEDLERKRNWDYSLEDNERWSEKLAQKQQRMDTGFASYDDSAQRKYMRDTEAFKPDLTAYQAQKAAAYGSAEAAGQIESGSSSNGALIQTSGSSSLIPGAEQLYRDANSFIYADHKPSDDALDRVIGQINQDIDKRMKRSRIRPEDDGDVTYINDRNKVFNKKLERYYSKFTGGIRDNFERGTAL